MTDLDWIEEQIANALEYFGDAHEATGTVRQLAEDIDDVLPACRQCDIDQPCAECIREDAAEHQRQMEADREDQ